MKQFFYNAKAAVEIFLEKITIRYWIYVRDCSIKDRIKMHFDRILFFCNPKNRKACKEMDSILFKK